MSFQQKQTKILWKITTWNFAWMFAKKSWKQNAFSFSSWIQTKLWRKKSNQQSRDKKSARVLIVFQWLFPLCSSSEWWSTPFRGKFQVCIWRAISANDYGRVPQLLGKFWDPFFSTMQKGAGRVKFAKRTIFWVFQRWVSSMYVGTFFLVWQHFESKRSLHWQEVHDFTQIVTTFRKNMF